MSNDGETFFTTIGCMDGRCQRVIADFGSKKFGALYPDTITEPGITGKLANNPSKELLETLKEKLTISLEKHHSRGIVVDGHAECTGNPVSDDVHRDNVRAAVSVVSSLVQNQVPVVGVFLSRSKGQQSSWEVEEIPQTVLV